MNCDSKVGAKRTARRGPKLCRANRREPNRKAPKNKPPKTKKRQQKKTTTLKNSTNQNPNEKTHPTKNHNHKTAKRPPPKKNQKKKKRTQAKKKNPTQNKPTKTPPHPPNLLQHKNKTPPTPTHPPKQRPPKKKKKKSNNQKHKTTENSPPPDNAPKPLRKGPRRGEPREAKKLVVGGGVQVEFQRDAHEKRHRSKRKNQDPRKAGKRVFDLQNRKTRNRHDRGQILMLMENRSLKKHLRMPFRGEKEEAGVGDSNRRRGSQIHQWRTGKNQMQSQSSPRQKNAAKREDGQNKLNPPPFSPGARESE